MHTIKHHIRGIKMVLAMMPKIQLEIPNELLAVNILDESVNSTAFNLHHELNFFNRLIDVMEDPLIGLRIAKIYHPEAYGIVGLAILTAPTLRTIFELLSSFGKLTYSLLNLSFEETDEVGIFNLTPINLKLSNKLRIFYADRDTGAAVHALDTVMRAPISYEYIELVHDGQGRQQDYIDYFGCDVYFNSSTNCCAVARDLLDYPLPLGQPEAYEFCLAECQSQLSQLARENDIIGQIRQEFSLRPGYLLDFSSMAAQLNMSERTLRRRLAELNTSYHSIQSELRYQISKDYLLNSSLMLKEIAELLGYSDPSTFTNAFKRWTCGISPRQFRQANRL